jgi:hypothetical protein
MIADPDGSAPGVKCLGCDELANNGHVICDYCKTGLRAIRGLDKAVVEQIVEVLLDPAMKSFFGLLVVDNFKKYMEEQIGDFAGNP